MNTNWNHIAEELAYFENTMVYFHTLNKDTMEVQVGEINLSRQYELENYTLLNDKKFENPADAIKSLREICKTQPWLKYVPFESIYNSYLNEQEPAPEYAWKCPRCKHG